MKFQKKGLIKVIQNPNLWHLLELSNANWEKISKLPLTKEFIEKFKNKLNWKLISIHQDLSEELIEKYKNLIDWDLMIEKNKNIKFEIKKVENFILKDDKEEFVYEKIKKNSL